MNRMTDRADEALGLEAAEWLLRLDDADPDIGAEFADTKACNQAFFDWVGQSPNHLRVFLETVETQRHMPLIDANRLIEVEDLLQERFADVIPLRFGLGKAARSRLKRKALATPKMSRRSRLTLAAAAVLLVIGGSGYWWAHEADAFTTSIGEQRTAKLDDGSFIYLNTDSRIEVDFSQDARNVRLVRGEALFVVNRDSARPFTVIAGNTKVRVLGTQFNVRRRAEGADVAVVEGAVQVASLDMPQKLVAGEQAKIVNGRITPVPLKKPIEEAVAWRERRLVFHDARLIDIAAEFNRYNRTQVRIEGESARDVLLSGIFDADRPQALMLYAAKNPDFVVEPEGNDWVIRGR